jgi:hypothetical protein
LIGDTPNPKFAEGVLAAAHLMDLIATELEGHQPDPSAGWQAIDPEKEAAAIAIARELRGPYV